MNTQPLFSILIANYNNGQYLQECLDSVFAQTYTNWEIILVDDASTDKISSALYKKYDNHPQIHIFYNEKNKGCGYTKRRCVKLASGEICGFLDPDDLLTTDAIELLIEGHLKNPNASLVYSTHYLCNADLTVKEINTKVGQIEENKSYLTNKDKVVSAFAAFKTVNYKKTSGINPSLQRAVDQDLYYKLEETGDFTFINKPLYYYRRHSNGISTAGNALKARRWHLKVIEDTYKRRKRTNFLPNIAKGKIRNEWGKYYSWKSDETLSAGNITKTFKFVMLSIYNNFSLSNIRYEIKKLPLIILQKHRRNQLNSKKL